MTEGKSYLPWPGADEKIIVQEMLRDLRSEQWNRCQEFVKKRVQLQAINIPQNHWDDIIQDIMIKIHRSLPDFQHQCALKTWMVGIIRNSIIDNYRKFIRTGQHAPLPDDPHESFEREGESGFSHPTRTVEEEAILHEELAGATRLLREYLSTHAHAERNARILDMVLNEGRSLEEVAIALGCSAPVAGYIVRAAQRYVREHLREKP